MQKKRHVPGNGVSWQIDRTVNITSVCISGRKFCAFHCGLHSPKAYTTAPDEYAQKVEELFAKGGNHTQCCVKKAALPNGIPPHGAFRQGAFTAGTRPASAMPERLRQRHYRITGRKTNLSA
jgi:hypothetical protein